MSLSAEDRLRLNVLMAQDIRAVRIDENRMQVYGLTPDGESRVDLNPAGSARNYIKQVREFLSGHVFGSPGGYPVFISRWTRMGQAKDENLQRLLMLGEPEAVVAVVHAKGLSPEVARYAWWCMPESENARRMLEKPDIAQSDLGLTLAGHLFEHLAFETDPKPMIDSVRLMLQHGLIGEDKRDKLWRSSQRKNAYLVGFLQAIPDELLHQQAGRAESDLLQRLIANEIGNDNPYFQQLSWLLSESGQGYLDTINTVLLKPANQDVVIYLLNTIRDQFAACMPTNIQGHAREIAEIDKTTSDLFNPKSTIFDQADEQWQRSVEKCEGLKDDLYSMVWMSQLSEEIVTPIFSQTTAEGTLMRKKLKPVTDHIFKHINQLSGLA